MFAWNHTQVKQLHKHDTAIQKPQDTPISINSFGFAVVFDEVQQQVKTGFRLAR
jgi:hypothetical protein